jgi:hypothetical protein
MAYPAYTVDKVLKMPYESFKALLEAAREINRKAADNMPKLPDATWQR